MPTKFHPTPSLRSYDVIIVSISQDGGRGVANLIPVACLVTALVWYIAIHGWVITTSGFRKQRSATLKCYFRFTIWPHTHHFGMLPFLRPSTSTC